jgi:hypothetical protein
MSKKFIMNFFDVLIFATSKNFDVAFLTKVLKRQKVAFATSKNFASTKVQVNAFGRTYGAL